MGQRRVFTTIALGLVGLLILGLLGIGGLIFFTGLRPPPELSLATPTPTATPEPPLPTGEQVIAMIKELTRATEQTKRELQEHYQNLYDQLQAAKDERDEFKELYQATESKNAELVRQLGQRTAQLESQGTITFIFSIIFSIISWVIGCIVGLATVEIRAFFQRRLRKRQPLPRTLVLRIDLSREEAHHLVMQADEADSSLPDIAKNLLLPWAGPNPHIDGPQGDSYQQ